MSKTTMKRLIKSNKQTRQDIYWAYENKYFNMFMSRYEWSGDITDEQEYYIMKRFWCEGTIAAFNIKGIHMLGFAPYSPNEWNIYDFPTSATLINTRGAVFIPSSIQYINKDIVIGYIQKNHKSIQSLVDYYIEQLVEVETAIRVNLNASKTPLLIAVSPEDRVKAKQLMQAIENGDASIFADFNDPNSVQALISGAPYLIDKLYAYKQALENELLTYLGIDNLGAQEKKEHLITSEVEVNNDVIDQSEDGYLQMMKDFCKSIKEVLGYNIEVKSASEKETEIEDEESEEETDNGTI